MPGGAFHLRRSLAARITARYVGTRASLRSLRTRLANSALVSQRWPGGGSPTSVTGWGSVATPPGRILMDLRAGGFASANRLSTYIWSGDLLMPLSSFQKVSTPTLTLCAGASVLAASRLCFCRAVDLQKTDQSDGRFCAKPPKNSKTVRVV